MAKLAVGELFEGREITNIFDGNAEEHIELDETLVEAIVVKNDDGTFTSLVFAQPPLDAALPVS